MWRIVLLFLCGATNLISAQSNNPFKDPKICGRPSSCDKGDGKFKYGPNLRQIYKYSVEVRSLFNGTSRNESTLSIESKVYLEFPTPCEGLLTLKDSKLREGGVIHPRTEDFSADLEAFSLRFSFVDGLITELCPKLEEKIWALNLKRGLLSMLHNSMKRFDLDSDIVETDVKGICETKYRVSDTDGTSLIIEKTKDLSTCSSRSKLHSVVQSVPYSFRAKAGPEDGLLKTSSKCVFTIDHHIYKSINCEESYLLKPFSNRGSGVTTIIKQDLVLDKEENMKSHIEQEDIQKRVPLIFDHTLSRHLVSANIQNTKNLVRKMCEMDLQDDHIEFSDIFTNLIISLRLLTPEGFSEIYDHSSTLCPTGRKNILDALPFVGNTGAFSVMKDLITTKAINPTTINDWTLSFALTRQPDEEMMSVAAELIEKATFEPSVILSLGALTHSFCSQHSNCKEVNGVQRITEHLENAVVELYSNDTKIRKNHDKIVVYMKSIGNAGQLSPSFEKKSIEIIEDKNLDIEIRIASLETHRKTPCDQSKDYFQELYRDAAQDAELRIAAYLHAMKCPNYLLMRTIRHTLETEEVNQVGSFVWSHLNNLLKSAVPSRVEIQGLISDKDLVKKFKDDIRKFSHNYEGSLFFEKYNVGGSYDSNLIFSPKSYVPTSVTINMTIDLFGGSINLFEISSRIHGFENYLEHLFGPKGKWSYSKLQDKIPKMRFARDVASQLLNTELQAIPNVMENEFSDPKVSLGIKIFGNDLRYVTYNGYDELKDAADHLNPMHYLQRILSGKDINYHKAMMFLDSNYAIPSGAGLPITLSAIGTSSLNMKLFGTINAENFSQNRELEVSADIKPTLSFDITGSLSVTAFYAKTELKVKTSIYSSTAVESDLVIKGFKFAKVKISIPKQRSEIFNSRSELLVRNQGKDEIQHGLKEFTFTRSICSWPVIDKTLGLKTCIEYNFVNVTKMRNAPYFILAGTAGFRIFLEKLDPKAKDFILEYKWLDYADTSAVSLIFDAPGSSLGRIIGANFTIDRQSQNLTLLIKTTSGNVLARGKYKNSPDEKYLQIAININDIKHFDTSLSLTRSPINHGSIYYPKFYIGVNNERVVEIQGSVKMINKRGVFQYDVDLKFQTKRVTSKLFGYISKTPATLATQLRMMYKFPKATEQGIDLSFSLANRSKRNIMDIQGAASLESSSYPQYDFDSKLKLLRGQAHTEGAFNITFNHKDDAMKWTNFGLLIIAKSVNSTKTIHTIVSLEKSSKNIDINADFKYESKAPNTNVGLVVDYGKNKQFSTSIFLHNNQKPLQDFKLQVNVSVPTFHPMLASFKLHEKQLSHYNVEFNGTWFSGHSLSSHGFFEDKSTSRSYDYHAKLLFKSPSFDDVFSNLQYYRDRKEFKLSLKFDQNNTDYMVLIKHLNASPEESSTLAKLKYRHKVYSLLATLFSGDHQRVAMEIHIDQMRDVHFAAFVHNKEAYKAAGVELKWDANRDPDQKLVFSGNFSRVSSFNYIANILASYPGRTLLGNYEFVLRRGHLNTVVRLSWDDDSSFAVIFNSDYDFDRKMYFVAVGEIVTPFQNWKQTFLDASFEHELNMYSLNGSLGWEKNQHISIDFFGNYVGKVDFIECAYRSVLSSTVKNIPSLSASFSHNQNGSVINTLLRLQYSPEEIIDVKSKWEVVSDSKSENYTGTVVASSPFSGFHQGYLISKVMITQDRYIRGIADLDLDFKKFSVNAEGRLKKLTNSMFTVNITTPIEKYSTINGRFGFIENQRYLVAMITYPSKVLGVEALLSIQSLTEFDTKFILGTPLQVLQRVIFIGKLKPETADFRAGWNSLLGGFQGKWHYVNSVDFEYAYIVYTPIENFEENSVILKVIIGDSVDLDVSVKLSSQKLGVRVLGETKPALLKDLDIKLDEIYGKRSINLPWEMNNKEENEKDGLLNWSGLVEFDTLIYPTLKGTLDIDQRGPVYNIKSILTVPDGDAVINDRFEYHGGLSMKNTLQITTPYTSYSVIDSSYELDISPGSNYIFLLDMNYQNGTELVENGLTAKYIIWNDTDFGKTHNITFHAKTPIVTFLNIDGGGFLSIKRNDSSRNYMIMSYLKTRSIDIANQADLKMNTSIVDANVFLSVKTATIYVPPVYLKYKREANIRDNSMEIHIDIPEMYKEEIYFHTDWYYHSVRDFNTYLNVRTPFDGFQKSILGIRLSPTVNSQTGDITIDIKPVEATINSTFKNDVFHTVAQFNVSGKSFPVILKCTTIKSTPVLRTLDGVLMIRNNRFNINGNIELTDQLPMNVHIELIPKEPKDKIILEYKITSSEDSNYKFIGSASTKKDYVRLNVDTRIKTVTDWKTQAKILTTNEKYKQFTVTAECKTDGALKTIEIETETPIKYLEKSNLGASLKNSPEGHHLRAHFNASTRNGNMDLKWVWLYLENMKIDIDSRFTNNDTERVFIGRGFYLNPNKEFKYWKTGAHLEFDRKWETGSNFTLILPSIQNVTIDGNLMIPPPRVEVHSVKGKLLYTTPIDYVEYLAKYNTLMSKKSYGSTGKAEVIKEGDNNRVNGSLGVQWAPNKIIVNLIEYLEMEDGYDVQYKLSTPKYKSKKAIVLKGSYRGSDSHHNLRCQVFKPEDDEVIFGKLNFKELANMNGLINITIPYEHMNYAGVNFTTETSAYVYNRYLEAFWPDSSAKIDAKCDIQTGETLLHRTRRGSILVEVPLSSKHIANVDYIYQDLPRHSFGNATVNYNKNKLLDGSYDCLTESRAGMEKDITHVEVQNRFFPIAVDYNHGYEYGVPSGEIIAAPSKDTKHVKLYHLTNRTKFAIEGNLIMGTTSTGQQLELEVHHLNKTVNFKSDYDIFDQEYKQYSRLGLGADIWIEYNISLLNETKDQEFDAQRLQLDVQYPLRNLTFIGTYKIGEESIKTDVALRWDVDDKYVEAELDWKRLSGTHKQISLILKHPTFEKNVTLLTEYGHDDIKIIDTKIKFDYSENPDQLFEMGGRLNDNSNDDAYNYTYSLFATHNATNLNLQGVGDFFWGADVYSTNHQKEYRRSYIPQQHSEAFIRLDFLQNEFELKRETLGQLSYVKMCYESNHPIYSGNLTINHEFNEAGGYYDLNLTEKVFLLNYNMTTDGRQSIHIYGDIPDARSAKFNAWRDYDDIKIDDISYYLRMNHSRLIVSSLLWRHDLLRGLQSDIHKGLHSIYIYITETINDTRQYVRSEIRESLTGIKSEAEPYIQNYMEDLRGLWLFEDDIEQFKIFLNNSYHANDFYIKTIVTVTMFTFDELALKKHFESVPAIISEIWGIMGASGKKIQKSIDWVIEKIVNYYKNITTFMRELLDGDPVQHLSDVFSKMLAQYDDFIRKMHVAFIQYIEKLWQQTYDLVVDNWYKMLIAIEPTFLKLVAYTESIAWSTSQEFLDFLYIRKNEIMISPYFVKFTNFTHDVDKFYKDITGNNTLSSMVKYTKIGWNFLRERYMDKLPFAKELEAIVKEIAGDLNKLRELPSVAYLEERLNQMFSKLLWFYDYFEVETRIQNFLTLMHKKLTDYSQTALQAENRYREAKTKFIFDPNEGKMHLEQKMPMSWHAFNETPNFHEIPEIKTVCDIRDFFITSHTNFWNFYYDYKPYTDPSEWLPPFKAQALIIGNKHYVTFDRRFYEFKGDCSYLLSADMKDHNFTLIVSYGSKKTHELLLMINKTLVEIDIFADLVKVGDSAHSQLPLEIGDTFIHRDSGIITVDSASGFLLECNTKFHVCTFEVSGWYFGKTAGLFGTINNEPSDDFLSSDKMKHNETNVSEFARTWALNKECAKFDTINQPRNNTPSKEVAQICEDLYTNKVSQFSSCFPRISKDPFFDMCLGSTTIDEACSSASAYTTLCSFENTPLIIPDFCIKCSMPNDSFLYEGEFVKLSGQNITRSVDVVFLIETKECNQNLTTSKNMKLLIDSLDEELVANNLMNNRYAMVLFGGDGVYNDPRVRSLNGEIFTNHSSVMKTLENIRIGNGSSDIFSALIYASRLNFRPAVSKTFILLPCSECHDSYMKFDYPILHQHLSENAISLHILMNDDFNLGKSKENKIPYGIDDRRAYTKKDFRILRGDESLRNHIRLPKASMGLCIPLALETNGTLFTSKYIKNEKDDSAKKFISVFTKRVAESSNSAECFICECTAPNSGISYMECYPCHHPSRGSIDDGFDEDELLMSLQPGESVF
ncbi:hypothetical protein HHI36_023721 [Cryptolaemus montrouzieri]|uniref:Vitellogenin domain-containing protein n=1 Tax=Cryptolaemus montrouzieri TaxID=559131 RepID=A0ABD2PHW0_9CUCU